MCNPIMPAMVLNDSKTEFNVLLELCVGHDSLLFQYAHAPCTVLAVEDRLPGHNPLAAICTILMGIIEPLSRKSLKLPWCNLDG